MPDTTQLPALPLLVAGALGGGASAAALWAYSVFAPRCQFWAPVIRSLPQPDAVALTFDDGPHPEFTPPILDILRERGIPAMFFVIGRFAEKFPEIVRRIAAEGHALGNHSLDHDHFGVNGSRAYWDRQLGGTQRIIAEITGRAPVFFRPPMGFKTRHIAGAARALGLPIVGWSVRGLDTRRIAASAVAQRIVSRTTGHDIILLHDGVDAARAKGRGGAASQQRTVEALPAILDGILAKRLRIVPLVESLTTAGGSAIERSAAPRG